MARKICFMVMPFSIKRTGLPPGKGPAEVDFDALWNRALEPALAELGYTPVRADQDVGALIIVEMIERLAYSDLVVADISVANANVYYEIGVRHAAKRYGCVLTSADWGHTLFDIDQMPRLVYPLADGSVPEKEAAAIRDVLKKGIPALSEGASPVYQAVPAFQEGVPDEMRAANFAADMDALNAVMNRIHAVEASEEKEKRERALALRDELAAEPALQDGVRIALMLMLRDCTDWETTIEYIDGLPASLRRRPFIREQLLLAKAKSGDDELAIASLQQLIEEAGPTAERWGLIGGRYKTLYNRALKEGDERNASRYLSRAIDAYERGMMADLNEYYPACNLPRLLRIRGDEGDLERARATSVAVAQACDRAQRLNPDDEWIPLTRLGLAFDSEDPAEAARIARGVMRDFEAVWKKATTIEDLRKSVALVRDPLRRRELQKVLIDLESVLDEKHRVTRLDELPAEPVAAEPPTAAPPAGAPTSPAAAAAGTRIETTRLRGKGLVVTIRIEQE